MPKMKVSAPVLFSVVIFTNIEEEQMKRDFTCNNAQRYNRNEADFTEYDLNTTESSCELIKNNSEKSIILAPFNSTLTHISQDLRDSVKELIINHRIVKFHQRVKEIDRQYEKNNNCELDNGVYNKAVEDEAEEQAKKDKEKEEGGGIGGSGLEGNDDIEKIIAKDEEHRKSKGPTELQAIEDQNGDTNNPRVDTPTLIARASNAPPELGNSIC